MPASFTIAIRHSFGAHESEQTIYVRDDRSREECRSSQGATGADGTVTQTYGPRVAIIRRCDLRRIFSLDLDAGEYDVGKLMDWNSTLYVCRAMWFAVAHPLRALKHRRKLPPTAVVETTTVDTGERNEMFGFTARRVMTTTRHVPLAAPSVESETKTDGWYIDIDPTIACERLRAGARAFLSVQNLGEPPEVPQFKDIGPRETGYPVDITSVHSSNGILPDGTTKTFTATSRQWVTQLSTEPIDSGLFEVPAGFRRKR